LVRRRALAHGAAGRGLLAGLPDALAHLAGHWQLQVGSVFDGGTAALVVAARTERGDDVVLKLAMPPVIDGFDSFAHAVTAYRLAGGRGCARLLAYDEEHSALLLERLGPNLEALGIAPADQLPIICATLRPLWVPVPAGTALHTGAEKAAALAT